MYLSKSTSLVSLALLIRTDIHTLQCTHTHTERERESSPSRDDCARFRVCVVVARNVVNERMNEQRKKERKKNLKRTTQLERPHRGARGRLEVRPRIYYPATLDDLGYWRVSQLIDQMLPGRRVQHQTVRNLAFL